MTSLSPDHVDGLQRRSSRSSRKSLPSKENVNPAGDPVTLMAVSKPSMKPKKQLSFAPTLMVYETFGHEEYDRTSEEPGTWKLLTPELARSIREELERFKMEEMLLHESYLNG
ncbi:hypothetical protein DL96DRAFT_870102 [Flagelloscypha sp. PMI_526]|nr:hypothetical protein DL96DRAFT_870102 [Flagelloscypha sp. PMI_526]